MTTPVVLGIDPQSRRLGLALVEFEPPHRALWADTVSIDVADEGWQYQQVGAALREPDRFLIASVPRTTPEPDCGNCQGRGCMGCIFREYDHDCIDDCPECCAGRTLPHEITRVGIELPPYVNNRQVFRGLSIVFGLVGAECHRRWPWAPQVTCDVGSWKKAVLGDGKASKGEVFSWAGHRLIDGGASGNETARTLRQDSADAVAIATYAAGVELVENAA